MLTSYISNLIKDSQSALIFTLLLNFQSTIVQTISYISNLFPEINVTEQLTELEHDGVTITLVWDELNPLYTHYTVVITITPETHAQLNVSRSSAQLIMTYNMMYNVSVMVSHPCEQSDVTVFTRVYYYPRTSARECSVLIFIKCQPIFCFNSSYSYLRKSRISDC